MILEIFGVWYDNTLMMRDSDRRKSMSILVLEDEYSTIFVEKETGKFMEKEKKVRFIYNVMSANS